MPNKKMAVIYGNCQTAVYKKAWTLSRKFQEDYVLIVIPQVWEYSYDPEMVKFFLNDKSFWKAIKLFVYQFVSKTNSYYEGLASEYCIGKLETDCQKVAIISLEFKGYFPQIEGGSREPVFGFRDKYVDALIERSMESNKIIDIVSEEKFIPDMEIERSIKRSLISLKKKDSFADVKIYDYIEKNYMKEQLFFSLCHPCDNLLREYTQRIFRYLRLKWDISDEYFAGMCSGGIMRGLNIAVYPSVVRRLGLKKYENRFYFHRWYGLENMILDFRQYMEMYIKHNILS